ncbi:isochorismate synthase [Staphylococcus aureus]|uniref:Isochorismate synthase n=1 Tax=Staphylococcus aureus TaxID=1280 RepID=A0A380DZJ3_STAAU|nr:isochorismate synthase [Staphylococcus aureus]
MISYISLIDNLHPTPALGGYPKEFAMDLLNRKNLVHEDYMVRRLAI